MIVLCTYIWKMSINHSGSMKYTLGNVCFSAFMNTLSQSHRCKLVSVRNNTLVDLTLDVDMEKSD